MKIPKILVERYQGYSLDEQRILQVISVIDQATSLTEIREVLLKLNWQTSTGILLSDFFKAKLRDRWVSDGVLIFKQNRMHCNSLITELITRKTVKENLFAEIILAADS